jgi:putative component of membrane protein insertase Oxa1/YidC/SpoIIIJ protein YidD
MTSARAAAQTYKRTLLRKQNATLQSPYNGQSTGFVPSCSQYRRLHPSDETVSMGTLAAFDLPRFLRQPRS